jgi:hypothetical protein
MTRSLLVNKLAWQVQEAGARGERDLIGNRELVVHGSKVQRNETNLCFIKCSKRWKKEKKRIVIRILTICYF